MATEVRPRGTVRFGVFEADLRSHELRKNGRRIRLQEHPFRLLAILLETPGEVVTRDELRLKLWPDDTFVEFDHSLNTAIQKIRQALGDSATSPRFIETLPRRGYRFVAPVEMILAEQPPPPARHRSPVWLVALALAALIVGSVVWFLARSTPEPPLTTVPLTSYPGREYQPSLSPDGEQVVFVWRGENQDNYDLYAKLAGRQTPPLRLTTHDSVDYLPAWSPDGKLIAFLRLKSGGKAEILLKPPYPGPEERSLGLVLRPPSLYTDCAGHYLSWSPDGRWLVVPDAPSPKEPRALYRISVDTGFRQRTTAPSEEGIAGDFGPAVAPDGRSIAFARMGDMWTGELWILPVNEDLLPTGEPKCLTSWNRRTSDPAWTPDSREIIVSSGRFRDGNLWRVDARGRSSPRRCPFIGAGAFAPTLSVTGNRLAYQKRLSDTNFWRVKLQGEQQPVPERLVVSSHHEWYPQYSPSGQRIAFSSTRSGIFEVWLCDADGANPTQLTSTGKTAGNSSWSPDGRQLAFNVRAGPSEDIYTIEVAGRIPRQLTRHAAPDHTPRWSADGEWVYFTSTRTGRPEIWKMRARGGDAVQVTRNGGEDSTESPDAKFVYYYRSRSLWRIPIGGNTEEHVLDDVRRFLYALVGGGVYFIPRSDAGRGSSLQFFEFATAKTQVIVDDIPDPGVGLAVSPDEAYAIYSHYDLRMTDLMLVENFR